MLNRGTQCHLVGPWKLLEVSSFFLFHCTFLPCKLCAHVLTLQTIILTNCHLTHCHLSNCHFSLLQTIILQTVILHTTLCLSCKLSFVHLARDHKLKSKEMDPNEFTEFLKRLSPLGIQWVVEWWCIIDMVNHVFKDNCVPLVGLCHCFYYSICCIARQFGDRQGVPNDEGIFHTLAFTNRILGRIRETWLKRMVAKDINFPQFLHPTSRYRAWLATNMRSAQREEMAYKKSNKRKRNDRLPWFAPKLTFLHFMILITFLYWIQ